MNIRQLTEQLSEARQQLQKAQEHVLHSQEPASAQSAQSSPKAAPATEDYKVLVKLDRLPSGKPQLARPNLSSI